jgi:hypothetical protein
MSTCFFSVVITMSVQVIPSAVVQRIIVKFLTNENVKPTEILMRLRAQFGDEMLTRTQVCDLNNHLKKAEVVLKTCEDYTFCLESYDQRLLGPSRHLTHKVSDITTNHQRS